MIDGSLIRLRTWQEQDVDRLLQWRNDVTLQGQLLARAQGTSELQLRAWLAKKTTNKGSLFFIISDLSTNTACGYIQFLGFETPDRRAEMGICIDPRSQGRGKGREAIALGIQHVKELFGLHKIVLRVRADNDRAIRCYESNGFVQCGTFHRDFYFDNCWHDITLMEHFTGPKES